jgi:fructose-1-phosphate kinase PfkB-like protein
VYLVWNYLFHGLCPSFRVKTSTVTLIFIFLIRDIARSTKGIFSKGNIHAGGGGTAVAQGLRYCVKNQKIAGSIPDGAMEFFIDINLSDRTMALGSTQPLKEMSTGSISW